MGKQLLLLICVTFLIPMGDAYSCEDDSRLPAALIRLSQGAVEIKPPLKVTPQTWLDMAPEFRALLGGNAQICPNIPVLKSGSPARRPELAFDDLWVPLRNAALRGDAETAKWIFSTFKAKDMTTVEIVQLIRTTGMTEEGEKLLCWTAGVPQDRHTMVLDFFAAMGGRSSDNVALLTGSALKADFFEENKCERFREWITPKELERDFGSVIPKKQYDTFNEMGIDVK